MLTTIACRLKSRKSCGGSVSADNGYLKPPKDIVVTAALREKIPAIVSSFPFFQRNAMLYSEHGHAQAELLRSENPGHSGSSEHGMRQARLFSRSWLGTTLSAGRKRCPYVPGIHQGTCTALTEEPGSSSRISAHQMKIHSSLALRLMLCLAPGR